MEATSTRSTSILIEDVTASKPDVEKWVDTFGKIIGSETTSENSEDKTNNSCTGEKQTRDEKESETLLQNPCKLDTKGIAKKGIAEIKKEVEETKDLSQEEKIWRLAETVGTTHKSKQLPLDEELESLD